ncbi:Protein of unknown function DUF4228 [Macleaya cordata]|uniref:DUF4228 domain-containing protein n=1 Tax=Macleaya cordata TaxID=56857 RepID=A0A200QUS5_MACCD|nr:Protein of unknown function DUF4228 [Macleaya cordata]
MGNYISCTLSISHTGKHSTNCAKVILPNGVIRQFEGPFLTKAAEIMFEIPNHFLVNSRSLHIGRRFSALNADEDLEMGNVYVMFPMRRVNSVVTAGDMGALMVTANSAANKLLTSASGNGKVRVLPESSVDEDSWVAMNLTEDHLGGSNKNWKIKETSDELVLPRLSLDDIDDFLAPDFQHRISMCRSRKPLLETITEEPVLSR